MIFSYLSSHFVDIYHCIFANLAFINRLTSSFQDDTCIPNLIYSKIDSTFLGFLAICIMLNKIMPWYWNTYAVTFIHVISKPKVLVWISINYKFTLGLINMLTTREMSRWTNVSSSCTMAKSLIIFKVSFYDAFYLSSTVKTTWTQWMPMVLHPAKSICFYLIVLHGFVGIHLACSSPLVGGRR